jgi:hypothetical protein
MEIFFHPALREKKRIFNQQRREKMFYDSNNSGERETGACDVPRL